MAKPNSRSGDIPNDGESVLPEEVNDGEENGSGEGEGAGGEGEEAEPSNPDGETPSGNEVPEVADPVLALPLLPIPNIDMIEAGAWQESDAGLPPVANPASGSIKKHGLMAGANFLRYNR